MTVIVSPYGKFLQEQLQQHDKSGFYEIPELELWGANGKYIPSKGDLQIGLEEIYYYRKQTTGRASLSAGLAFDIPLVDFGITRNSVKTQLVIAGAEWNFVELEQAKLANSNSLTPNWQLITEKANAVRDAVNRRIHELVMVGSINNDFYGLFNSDQITPVTDATIVFNLTQVLLMDWITTVLASFKTSSKLPFASITAYVSDDLFRRLAKRFSDNTGDSPLSVLLNPNTRLVGSIEPITELSPATLLALGAAANATTTGGMMLLGDFTGRSINRSYYALNRTDPFLKDSGVHWGITGFAATSEIQFNVPERFARIVYDATPHNGTGS
jgi:hypothetical protein